MFSFYRKAFSIVSLSALVACGGGGGDDSSSGGSAAGLETGVFLDSPIVNIGYRTESPDGVTREGATNAAGQYNYQEGDMVTFFIGDLEFPAVAARGVVTPLDIAGTESIEDQMVINMIRLLQTLDNDGDPDNGITITELAKSYSAAINFDVDVATFAGDSRVTALISNAGQVPAISQLVSAEQAKAHFAAQLAGRDNPDDSIVGAWAVQSLPEVHIGGTDFSLLTFLANGTYYLAESNEINEGDGFESGTYTFSDGVIHIQTVVDTNPEIGFSAVFQESASLAITLSGNTFSFPTSDERESGDYSFARYQISGGITGGWASPDGNAVLVFLPDGNYVGYQSVEENGFVGFEWGTYTYADGMLTTSSLDNSDREALLDNSPSEVGGGSLNSVTLDGDTLTLVIEGEGEFALTRVLDGS